MGGTYAAAICRDGTLLTWGYGGHGNLGHGNRKSCKVPKVVKALRERGVKAVQVSCTRGQEGMKGGVNPKTSGGEGPHTNVVSSDGRLFTFGTAHKGLLLNLSSKTGAFGEGYDELLPYEVGGDPVRNAQVPPFNPHAMPHPYNSAGLYKAAASGHIHSGAVTAKGEAYAWGCGSNDGRCGVERFLNMSGEGKPPRVDAMKCYMMAPHRVGVAREAYWPHRGSLPAEGGEVVFFAVGRNTSGIIVSGG